MLVVADRGADPADLGQRPRPTSAAKSPGNVGQEGLLVQRRRGFWYWENYGRTLSVVSPIFRMVSML